jgi:hypothetical protein
LSWKVAGRLSHPKVERRDTQSTRAEFFSSGLSRGIQSLNPTYGWNPTHSSLIADLEAGDYPSN